MLVRDAKSIHQRDIDLAIEPIDERMHGVGYLSEVLMKDPMEVVAERRHPLVTEAAVRGAPLRPCSWIAPPPNTLMHRRLEKAGESLADAG